MASEDFVTELGTLTLDHRLKRLSLRLLAEARDLYERAGLDFRPRWVSTYKLLDAEGPLAVGQIAERLGLSHPAVIQLTREMRVSHMLRSHQDRGDARRRMLSLSDKAVAMRHALEPLWQALAREQAALFDQAGGDVLLLLDGVTASLNERSLVDRVLAAAEL